MVDFVLNNLGSRFNKTAGLLALADMVTVLHVFVTVD